MASKVKEGKVSGASDQLTEQEMAILGYKASGITRNDDIAAELHISGYTVKGALSSIYAKLGLTGNPKAQAEAVAWYLAQQSGTQVVATTVTHKPTGNAEIVAALKKAASALNASGLSDYDKPTVNGVVAELLSLLGE